MAQRHWSKLLSSAQFVSHYQAIPVETDDEVSTPGTSEACCHHGVVGMGVGMGMGWGDGGGDGGMGVGMGMGMRGFPNLTLLLIKPEFLQLGLFRFRARPGRRSSPQPQGLPREDAKHANF